MIRYPYRMFLFPLLFAFLAFNQDAPPPAAAVPLRLIVVNSAAEAAAIRRQLENGADFAVLAREKSTDATAADGGLLGTADPASLRAEVHLGRTTCKKR